MRSEAFQNGENEPKLPVSAENIALKYLYGLLTEALGNLSPLRFARRLAQRGLCHALTGLSQTFQLLSNRPSPRAVPASALAARCQRQESAASTSEATQRRRREISLRSRRDPTSPSSVAFDLSPEFLLCPARALLQTPEQLVFLAFGVSKIIVGELPVFLLQLSLHLVPSAFECEFVHSHFSFGTSVQVARKGYRGTSVAESFNPLADLRRKLMRYIKAYDGASLHFDGHTPTQPIESQRSCFIRYAALAQPSVRRASGREYVWAAMASSGLSSVVSCLRA